LYVGFTTNTRPAGSVNNIVAAARLRGIT